MAGTKPTSALVVGAGIAGLLSARALADHVDKVVVFEREKLHDTADPRGHVPQGKHLHLFLGAGLDRLVAWFPGIDDELESLGAVRIDGTRAWLFQAGGYRARGDWGLTVLSMTRPLLEQVVRRRLGALPAVTIEDGAHVERVTVAGDTVTGVALKTGDRRADFVVDASGRNSKIVHQLESSGVLAPQVSRVSIDCAYASRFLTRSDDDFEGSFIACATSPPTSYRGGVALPVEGGRWMVTLAGVHGDVPPTDEQGFREFAGSLLSPTVGQLLDRCEPISPIVAYRFPSSQRRHFERARLLSRFVAVGDAACSLILSTDRAWHAPRSRRRRSARSYAASTSVRLTYPRFFTGAPPRSSTRRGQSPSAQTSCTRKLSGQKRAAPISRTAT